MGEVPVDSGPKAGGSNKNPLKLAVSAVVLIGLAGFLYVIASSAFKPADDGSLLRYRTGELAKLDVPGEPRAKDPRAPEIDPGVQPPAAPAPDLAFTGPDGKPVRISDFKGQVVVVNMWATWCAPCKIEMPTLGKLQAVYAVQPLQVVAISTDKADPSKYPGETDAGAIQRARAELAKSPPLKFYHSPGLDLAFAFNPPTSAFPTTVIYDKKGVERARLVDDANWNSKEARDLIEHLLKEG
jgi:thiol-disulfide isomerase/thioredoxin